MATGRLRPNYMDYRVYQDGYNLSGFGRSIAPLQLEYGEIDMTANMSDSVKGYFQGDPQVNIGTLNAVFDNTATTGLHTVAITAGTNRTVTVALGVRAAPAAGDPCFGGSFVQGGYQAADDGGAVVVNIPYMGWAANASTLAFACPWGVLLHAYGAETAANAGTGFDNPTADQTLKGGYFVYHLFTSNAAGTATVSVDDSANNADWVALSGATSGAIAFGSIPTAGVIALGNGATVRRYLRWQLALAGGMTTCTFVASFHRNY